MAKLITFDNAKKIKYFGGCKIEFNGIEKFLKFKLVNEDETVLSIKFDYTFIKKENFLCAFNNNDVFSILVIFGKVQTCETIYNGIIKSKDKNNQSQIIFGIDEAEIFKTAFFIPLIKEIQNGVSGYADLKMIVLGLVNSFENDEKILYLNLLAELLLIPTVIKKEETLGVRRKRPYRDIIKKNDVERTSNISVNYLTSSSSATTAATIPTNPLNPVTFDIVKYRENGTFNKRLLQMNENNVMNIILFIVDLHIVVLNAKKSEILLISNILSMMKDEKHFILIPLNIIFVNHLIIHQQIMDQV